MQQTADLNPELVEEVASRGAPFVTKMPLSDRAMSMFWDRFTCRKCGVCCTGEYVGRTDKDGIAIHSSEMGRLASYLLMTPRAFKKRHTFHTGMLRAIKYPCPFYSPEEEHCPIYQHRPMVCITFPINQAGWAWIAGTKIHFLTISLNCPAAKDIALDFIKVDITKEELRYALDWQAKFQSRFGSLGE